MGFAERGATVTGIDFSRRSLDHARAVSERLLDGFWAAGDYLGLRIIEICSNVCGDPYDASAEESAVIAVADA